MQVGLSNQQKTPSRLALSLAHIDPLNIKQRVGRTGPDHVQTDRKLGLQAYISLKDLLSPLVLLFDISFNFGRIGRRHKRPGTVAPIGIKPDKQMALAPFDGVAMDESRTRTRAMKPITHKPVLVSRGAFVGAVGQQTGMTHANGHRPEPFLGNPKLPLLHVEQSHMGVIGSNLSSGILSADITMFAWHRLIVTIALELLS